MEKIRFDLVHTVIGDCSSIDRTVLSWKGIVPITADSPLQIKRQIQYVDSSPSDPKCFAVEMHAATKQKFESKLANQTKASYNQYFHLFAPRYKAIGRLASQEESMSLLRSLSFKAKKERPASTTVAAAVSLLDEHGEFETYDALLSYDWGDETDGYLTKARVEAIEAMLVEQNVKVWRDETHMPDGLSREALTKGVMQSDCILVFVTKQYMDRLDDPLFKCSTEFELALTHTRGKRMIPCVLDAEMLDSSKWTVPLVHLAKADIVDMTSEAAIAESIPGLVKRVLNAML